MKSKILKNIAMLVVLVLSMTMIFGCASKNEPSETESTEVGTHVEHDTFGQIMVESGNFETLKAGEKIKFITYVNNRPADVTWIISGNTANDTTIDQTGQLIISEKEKSEEIVVYSILNEDSSVQFSIKVPIYQERPTKATETTAETTTENPKESTTTSPTDNTQTQTSQPTEPPTEAPVYNPPAHEHSYSANTVYPTCTSNGYTEHYCSCGAYYTDGYVEALGHNYSSYVASEPTCTSNGSRVYTCSRCGNSYSETLYAYGHNYYREYTVDPTTSSGGYTVYKCANCGNTYNDDYTDPLPTQHVHSWKPNLVVVNENGEIKTVQKGEICEGCGATR